MTRVASLAIVLGLALPAFADDATPPTAAAPTDKRLGIGYKLGDGIGFYGADVIVGPVPHVVLDLYGTVVRLSAMTSPTATVTGTGYAVAPAIQYHLFAGGRSTPYAAIGLQYVHLTLGDASGSGLGGFANIGYEWKWKFGLGIELGGGVQYLSKAEASNGTAMVSTGGKAGPNLEFGLRYMFL